MLTEVGSVWRKWDLHVHTPFSALNNGYGSDWDVYAKNLLRSALDNEIHAIGITDYFTIDGYKKLKSDYLDNYTKLQDLDFDDDDIDRINKILFIPNVEFRLDILVPSKKINNRVNFHVLFSEEVPIFHIEENFLHELDFVYEGRPQSTDEVRKLKVANLIELGQKLKREQEQFRNDTDLVVGMQNVVVNSTHICNALDKGVFKNKYLLVVPADEDLNQVDWKGQGHNSRKTLIQKSDLLMASNPNTILWGLGKKSDSVSNFINEFKSLKPCIWGSDAHDYDELFLKNKERLLWIKSELNFDGLKQVVHEPKRIYIGIEPESRKNKEINPSNFIERITVEKVSTLASNEEWFDKIDLKLNSGLVAIIGNKGSGKTALADIIALCGNARKPDNYSFLTANRFNKSPENKGRYFKATAQWADGRYKSVLLNDKPLIDEPERVNYIPQSFLEKLCLPEAEKGLFETELRKIIYSRIPIEQRLSKNSLGEIISSTTEVIRNSIEQTKSEIKLINDKIIELEEQSKPEYKKRINDEIDAANMTLTVLLTKEPVKPELSDTQNLSEDIIHVENEIEEYRDSLEIIDTLIEQAIKERETIYLEISEISKSIQSFTSFQESIKKFVSSQTTFLSNNNVNISDVFTYHLDYSLIERLLIDKKDKLELLNSQLNYTEDVEYNEFSLLSIQLEDEESTRLESLYEIRNKISGYITNLQEKLDQPAREYQTYLSALAVWNQDLNDTRSNLNKLEGNRDYLNILHDNVLAYHYKERQELTVELFYQKSEILENYKELYKPMLDFKKAYQDQLASYKIDFDATFQLSGFLERFDSFINYGKSGSFYSKDSAMKKINTLIDNTDFNDVNSTLDFVNYIMRDLMYDTRNPANFVINTVQSQLKQSIKTEDIYEYLFSLEYLKPVFQLKLAGKEISSLSPGEREALLLIFYLLLDNDKSPLIIDQPEENLDNQSIYNILVPFVQEAKQRRQVIIVTHNPNLAVVCDADQIIHIKIDKNDNHIITCTSGSIENPKLNGLIIEVLEGTFPAFDTRNQRYDVTRSRMQA